MKVNLSFVIKQFDGSPLRDESDKEVIAANICVNALLTTITNEQSSGEELVKRYRLAEKIYNHNIEGKEVNLNVDEITMLRDRLPKVYGAYLVGSLFKILEI